MLTQTYLRHTGLVANMCIAQKEAKDIVKRISDSNLALGTRQVGKLSLSHPLILFDEILKQVMSCNSVSELVVKMCRDCTSLGLDIVGYSLIRHITEGKIGELDQEANLSLNLKALSVFGALFYTKYGGSVDMRAILIFLLNKLDSPSECNEIVVLKELISKMFGWSTLDV